MELMKFAIMLQSLPDRDSEILSSECKLAIKIDQFSYDFGKHMKERSVMEPNVLRVGHGAREVTAVGSIGIYCQARY